MVAERMRMQTSYLLARDNVLARSKASAIRSRGHSNPLPIVFRFFPKPCSVWPRGDSFDSLRRKGHEAMSIAGEVTLMEQMSVNRLQTKYAELFGEPCRSPHNNGSSSGSRGRRRRTRMGICPNGHVGGPRNRERRGSADDAAKVAQGHCGRGGTDDGDGRQRLGGVLKHYVRNAA